ncbi:hypothetical protein AVEN_195528-1 [Araneus ventricosus]|uniref:Uncharacterized protein n=1 Tax=Araneus ventricosus TaxID=182803 RepID=A0A4Y2ICA2_ARAVE|nr:hypothetical protein AVEN_195528-1 [Araneus ventricosus]
MPWPGDRLLGLRPQYSSYCNDCYSEPRKPRQGGSNTLCGYIDSYGNNCLDFRQFRISPIVFARITHKTEVSLHMRIERVLFSTTEEKRINPYFFSNRREETE